MSWDELLEGVFSGYFKIKDRLRRKQQKALLGAPQTVRLEDVRPRLTLLARALTGSAIEIFPAEREGGYKNNEFFLPVYFAGFPDARDNLSFYLYRTLYLYAQRKLGLNWPPGTDAGLETSRLRARETSGQVLEVLFDEFPAIREVHKHLFEYFEKKSAGQSPPDLTWLYGKWMVNRPEAMTGGDKLREVDGKIKKAIQDEIKTVLQARAVEEMETLQPDRKQQEDQVVHNYFEKIETLEEFKGGIWKDFDGSDELEEHANALEELQMSRTVRVDDETHSVLQADFKENISVAESDDLPAEGRYITYDEWDYARRKYKKDYCKLFPVLPQGTDLAYYQKTIRENAVTLRGLRKMLANMHNRYREVRRQTQGDNFDLDALVEMYSDIHSGHTPTEKIYTARRRAEKDLSVLLLLDISLSSDGYAAGNRVIDVEKQVSILFGEILNEYETDFSVAAFYSKTRNHSSYVTLKDFNESWDKGKMRIGVPQPQGYTRIGPALRHAGSQLIRRHTRNKWLILLSDGKPNDYDRYEGRYGIADVKQALREIQAAGIGTYALAIEAQARYYLPQMFGQNHYQILTTPQELLQALVKLYEKIRY